MEKNKVLSLFDQNRKNPGKTFETGKHFVRQPGKNGAKGMVYFSCYPSDELVAGIKDQISYFSRLQQDFEWKVFEHDQPKNLKEILMNQGFNAEPWEAFLVRDFEDITDKIKVNPKVKIKRLTKLEEVSDYEKVLKSVHGEGQQPWLRKEFIEQPEIASLYVAYIKNVPVSIGRLCFDEEQPDFAGFFGGSTLPEYRRQGIYTALVFARIQEAIDKGYRYGYVDALPTSEPILKKMGFEKISASCPLIWKHHQ